MWFQHLEQDTLTGVTENITMLYAQMVKIAGENILVSITQSITYLPILQLHM